MNIMGPIFRKKNTATTVWFCLEDGASTDAYTGTDVVAADSTVVALGTSVAAQTTNAVVTVGSPFFSVDLTAAEMNAENVMLRITDASGSAFKDLCIHISTVLIAELRADTHNIFDLSEGSEPTTELASTSTFKEILQWLKRRWNNRHEVVDNALRVYKDNSTDILSTQVVTNEETTKSIGKAT